MPTLTRFFIKAGLFNFAAALVLGVLQQFPDAWPFAATLTPVYFHLFMFGWITQIIIGVSIWMFPPLSKENPRGSDRVGWFCFWSLNAGLLLRVAFEPVVSGDVTSYWRFALVGSAFLQWAAGLLYVGVIWNRVRGK
jgi:hypothetical protein